MTVSVDQHSGFCFGVTGAIRTAEAQLRQGQLFCLGDIVHNGQEVERLELMGLQTIDYDALRSLRGGRVLLRAHGEPPSTYHIAEANEIEIIDATCPVVKRLQQRIRQTYEAHPDAQIVIFGKVGHAEVIGLKGQTHDTALVIETENDLEQIDFSRPVFLFSQTTKSVEAFRAIIAGIEQRRSRLAGPLPVFEWHDTICRNVAGRVDRLKEFARQQDIVFFVGGEKSSNAKVLFAHCCEANPGTLFITSPDEVSRNMLPKDLTDLKVGVCGATSTPLWLLEQVKQTLEEIDTSSNR